MRTVKASYYLCIYGSGLVIDNVLSVLPPEYTSIKLPISINTRIILTQSYYYLLIKCAQAVDFLTDSVLFCPLPVCSLSATVIVPSSMEAVGENFKYSVLDVLHLVWSCWYRPALI